MSARQKMQDLLAGRRNELLAEYDSLAGLGIDAYLEEHGLNGQYRSTSYFLVQDGRYLDMKAPIRVALAGVDLPVQQSNAMYRAMLGLNMPVVHDPAATRSAQLKNGDMEREVPRYLALARPQQTRFRKAVMETFKGKCCLTGCSTAIALEAAHIVPYARYPESRGIDHVSNGLLLRRDIHALFDADMITLHPADEPGAYTVTVRDPSGFYSVFEGKTVMLPGGANRDRMAQRLAERFKA